MKEFTLTEIEYSISKKMYHNFLDFNINSKRTFNALDKVVPNSLTNDNSDKLLGEIISPFDKNHQHVSAIPSPSALNENKFKTRYYKNLSK